MEVQILLSTMNRTDFSFLEKMNLFGNDIVVVNQCDKIGVKEISKDSFKARVLDVTHRGLSNSRNQAMLYVNQEIFVTADDDISYYLDAKEKITKAFHEHPEADIIAFNIKRYNAEGRNQAKEIKEWREAPKNKYYSSVSIAYRSSSIKKSNLCFHSLFGAGSKYRSGEESLLLREARKKGLRIFECPDYIANVDFSESSWFTGYDERFFFDKGAWVKAAYPIMYRVMKYYYLKKKNAEGLSGQEIINALNSGIDAYENGVGFDECNHVAR